MIDQDGEKIFCPSFCLRNNFWRKNLWKMMKREFPKYEYHISVNSESDTVWIRGLDWQSASSEINPSEASEGRNIDVKKWWNWTVLMAIAHFDKRGGYWLTGYSCKRRPLHWPIVIFFNILDISAYDTFVIWMALNPDWNRGKLLRRWLSLRELGKALMKPQIQRRQYTPRTSASVAIVKRRRRILVL